MLGIAQAVSGLARRKMEARRALRILRAGPPHLLRARRAAWDRHTFVMDLDVRRAIYNSSWLDGPIRRFVKMVYDPYCDPRTAWSFDVRWEPTPDDEMDDWDLGSSSI